MDGALMLTAQDIIRVVASRNPFSEEGIRGLRRISAGNGKPLFVTWPSK